MLSKVTQLAVLTLLLASLSLVAAPTFAQEQPQPIDQGQPQAIDQDQPQATDQEQPQPIDQPAIGSSSSVTPPRALGRTSGGTTPGGATMNVLNKIRDLLDNQALFGQTSANNPVLADLETLVQKYSVVNLPKVEVINFGPGTVEIEKPDGIVISLSPRFGVTLGIAAGQTNLVAINGHSKIHIKHAANGRCRFWDGDDNRFSILQSSPRELEVTLGHGLQNYHFEP